MRTTARLTVAALALACGVANAHSIKPHTATTSFGIGSYYFDGDVNVGDRPLYNFTFGYDLSHHWGSEFMIGRLRTQQDGTNVTFDGSEWTLAGLYHFNPASDVVFFGMAGLGQQELQGPGTLNRYSRFLNAGLGLKYFFHKDWSVRMDGRYYRLRWNNEAATSNRQTHLHGTLLNFMIGKTWGASKPQYKVRTKGDALMSYANETKSTRTASVDVKFGFDKTSVDASYHGELERLAKSLKKDKKAKIRLTGHTDAKGNAAYNQKLSERRAQAVAKVLQDKFGVKSDRIIIDAKGPFKDDGTQDALAKRPEHRNVEATISRG